MDASCLQYALTEAERLEFSQRGYLVFDEMLPPDVVDALVEVSDRIDAEERQKRGVGPYDRLTVRDMVWRDERYLDLVDWPRALPKIWGTLGWNIQIYHTVLAYSPAAELGNQQVEMQGWHQDSGRVNQEIESSPRPRISVKMAYFLSDCSAAGRANFLGRARQPSAGRVRHPRRWLLAPQRRPRASAAGRGGALRPPDLALGQFQRLRYRPQGALLRVLLSLAPPPRRPDRRTPF